MSMLSDKKRKTKWSLNPRGHLWTQDESKFGQKMLEKLGWEKGTGLGAKKQGITDIISLKSIDENQGLGFKGNKDEWIAHQDDFASVLASLSEHHSNDLEEKAEDHEDDGDKKTDVDLSLESKSRNTKKRIHYHKFTRSKDTSSYSSSDLNSILGSEVVMKKKKQKDEEEKEKEKKEKLKTKEAEVEKCDNGLLVIKGGSIDDYFAKKMMELKKRRESSLKNESTKGSSSELVESVKKSEEDGSFNKSIESIKAPSDILNEKIDIPGNDTDTVSISVKKKKKRKRNSNEDECDPLIHSGCQGNFDGEEESIVEEGGTLTKDGSSEENLSAVKKSKKKKRKKRGNSEAINIGEESEKVIDSSPKKEKKDKSDGAPVKKKSKKRKESNDDPKGSNEESCQENIESKVQNMDSESRDPEKSKKDKSDSAIKVLSQDTSAVKTTSTNNIIIKPFTKKVNHLASINKKCQPNFKSWNNRSSGGINYRRNMKKKHMAIPINEWNIKFRGSNLASISGYGH